MKNKKKKTINKSVSRERKEERLTEKRKIENMKNE